MNNFEELIPKKIRSSNVKDDIRVSFPKLKGNSKYTMLMYIGKNIAEKVGIHGEDKVKFYVDKINPRLWLIKKSTDDIGYKVLDIKSKTGKYSDTLRVQMTWTKFKPNDNEIPVHTVQKYDLYEGGIRIIL